MLTQVEHDFIDFMAQRRGRARSNVEKTFLKTRKRFEFATPSYRALCDTIHDLFEIVYGATSEKELIASYRFHAVLHLFRFLSYSQMEETRATMTQMTQQARTLVELIKEKPVVVDYGCGLGYVSFMIGTLRPDSQIYLVDIDCMTFEFALYRFKKHHVGAVKIPVTESDIYPELPAHNICLALEVMEHLARPMIAYRNICNSLRRGGILIGYFGSHKRELFHVSPDLAELRSSVAKDFENIEGMYYRKL